MEMKSGPFVHGSDIVPCRATLPKMTVAHEFVEFTMEMKALRFGEFTTKAGRLSPYFLNAGLFNDGDSIARLAQFYAKRTMKALSEEGLEFDMLYGLAYKGIPLVTALSVVMFGLGINLPIVFNRKERKDHGGGGTIIGAPLCGRVLIVDDVISAGTSVRESVEIIRNAGAVPAGVLIALDRQERGMGELSATQEVTNMFGIPVFAVATPTTLSPFLARKSRNTGFSGLSISSKRILVRENLKRFCHTKSSTASILELRTLYN